MGNPLRVRRPVAELAARGQVIEIAEKIGSFKQLAGIVDWILIRSRMTGAIRW
jgi:hypothetical protein